METATRLLATSLSAALGSSAGASHRASPRRRSSMAMRRSACSSAAKIGTRDSRESGGEDDLVISGAYTRSGTAALR